MSRPAEPSLSRRERQILDVTYSGAMPEGRPFASMRSMYTTEYNADVAHVSWRMKGGTGWGEQGLEPGAVGSRVRLLREARGDDGLFAVAEVL